MRGRAALILSLAMSGAPAWADSLIVADVPEGLATPPLWDRLLREVGRPRVQVQERAAARLELERRADASPSPPPPPDAGRSIEEARARFRETRLREALDRLATAESELGPWFADPEGAPLAWEIAFLRGAWHLALDEPEPARAAFRAAVALDAGRDPPEGTTPGVDRAFRETRSALLAEARSVIRVDSTPPGASLWVDGIPLGATPRSVEIVPGQHRIRLALPGWSEATSLRVLASGEAAEHRETLRRAPPADVARQLAGRLREEEPLGETDLDALARLEGAARTGTLRLLPGRPLMVEALIVSPGASPARLGPIPLPDDLDAVRGLAARLRSLLGAEDAAAPPRAARRGPAPPRRSWVSRHWPWIAVIGAVAVAGASAALFVPGYGEGTVDVTARRGSW